MLYLFIALSLSITLSTALYLYIASIYQSIQNVILKPSNETTETGQYNFFWKLISILFQIHRKISCVCNLHPVILKKVKSKKS